MNTKRAPWRGFLLILLVPVVGLALGVAITALLDIGQTAYGNLVVNLFFLAACVGLWRALAFSRRDVGLEILEQHTRWHVLVSLTAFSLYLLFYLFAIRISGLKPFSSATAWGFLTYLVVALAEELYFRGMLYSLIEKRFSARIALIATSFLFGLFHVRQGLGRALSRAVSGWLWGSVRYSSGMIFLLIFPVHLVYNSAWLLFEGNWSNPPTWAIYALPAAEYLLGLAFLFIHDIVRTD
jgi:membrane protease YdiL (CAAX protease family)